MGRRYNQENSFRIPFNSILCSSPYAGSLTHSVVWQTEGGQRCSSTWDHRLCDHISRRQIRHGWDVVECSSVWRCESHWRRHSSCNQAVTHCLWGWSVWFRVYWWLTLCSRVCTWRWLRGWYETGCRGGSCHMTWLSALSLVCVICE
jgi:hypothetical protein